MIDKPHQVHNHPLDEIARKRRWPLGSKGARCAEAQEPPDTGVKQEVLSLDESTVSQSDDQNSEMAKIVQTTDDIPPSSCHEAETEFQEGVKFASNKTEHNHSPMSENKSSLKKEDKLFDEESDLVKTERCDEDAMITFRAL